MPSLTSIFLIASSIIGPLFFGISHPDSPRWDNKTIQASIQNTQLYETSDLKIARHALPSSSLVMVTKGVVNRNNEVVCLVQNGPFKGWARKNHFRDAELVYASKKANAKDLAEPKGASSDTPILLQLSQSATLNEAWLEIDNAVKENEKLSVTDRLPGPLFSRSDLWFILGHYPEALHDLVEGMKYARSQGVNPDTYYGYIQKLNDLAGKVETKPQAVFGNSADLHKLARLNFGKGIHQFNDGSIEDALVHFTHAVQLVPSNSIYWYYRAIANKKLGHHPRAQHDVVMGVYFERDYGPLPHQVASSLTHIQGESRAWLERFRDGTRARLIVGK